MDFNPQLIADIQESGKEGERELAKSCIMLALADLKHTLEVMPDLTEGQRWRVFAHAMLNEFQAEGFIEETDLQEIERKVING